MIDALGATDYPPPPPARAATSASPADATGSSLRGAVDPRVGPHGRARPTDGAWSAEPALPVGAAAPRADDDDDREYDYRLG